jgi:hypothetical protein
MRPVRRPPKCLLNIRSNASARKNVNEGHRTVRKICACNIAVRQPCHPADGLIRELSDCHPVQPTNGTRPSEATPQAKTLLGHGMSTPVECSMRKQMPQICARKTDICERTANVNISIIPAASVDFIRIFCMALCAMQVCELCDTSDTGQIFSGKRDTCRLSLFKVSSMRSIFFSRLFC